jgi:hypothetical protein
MTRGLSKLVAESAACRPFREVYARAVSERWSRWKQAEGPFLSAMRAFDAAAERGGVTQGENQNGKGDFLTDLVCVLLEHCSGKPLQSRPAIPGLVFPKHALDAVYPAEGSIEVLVETKALGAPKTARNPLQKNPLGRPGSADLDKRVKEAALKTIDLKAEWARNAAQGGGPTSDLLSWLKSSKPSCFLMLTVRVISETDFQQAEKAADAAAQLMDGVGMFCFRPEGDAYVPRDVRRSLDFDIVLSRVCDRLRAL